MAGARKCSLRRCPRAPLAGPTAGLHLDTVSDSLVRLAEALSGRYTIQRELGAGGMATVYLADDLKHERQVAVKVLRPDLAAALGPERFLREIKTTAGLNHPHILTLLDSGEAPM